MNDSCIMEFVNSDILKLLTVLLAIMAIVAIFLKHKPQGQSIRKIHIWYICGIATFVIVELVTWICIGNPESTVIMQTVSFAATLASLILSVLAIFITVISNDSLVRVKDSLNDVPKQVSDSVEKSLSKLTNLSETLESSANKNKEDQEATVKQISDMLDKLEQHMVDKFKDHERKFDDLDQKIKLSVATTRSMQDEIKKIKPKDELIEMFVNNTSPLAHQIIFGINVYLQHKASKIFSIPDFLSVLGYKKDDELSMYIFCVVMMLSSFGLVEYTQASDSDFKNLVFTSIHEPLASKSYDKVKDELSQNGLEAKINNYISSLITNDDDEQPNKDK